MPDHGAYGRHEIERQNSVVKLRRQVSTSARLQDEKVVEFIRDADVVIGDTQYDEAEYPKRLGCGHTCARMRKFSGDDHARKGTRDCGRLADDRERSTRRCGNHARIRRQGVSLTLFGRKGIKPPLKSHLSGEYRPPTGWRRIIRSILALTLVLATIAFAVHALALLYDGRYSVTRQDYWRIYALDFKFPFPLNALYRHNDHPTFFPSLLWLPILYFFQNNQTLLFWVGQVVTLTTLALLLVSLWRSPSLGLLPRLALGLIYTLATLWLGKANVIASGGFSCMTSLLLSAVVAGLLALGQLKTNESTSARGWLFVSVLAAGIVATFSSAERAGRLADLRPDGGIL